MDAGGKKVNIRVKVRNAVDELDLKNTISDTDASMGASTQLALDHFLLYYH